MGFSTEVPSYRQHVLLSGGPWTRVGREQEWPEGVATGVVRRDRIAGRRQTLETS